MNEETDRWGAVKRWLLRGPNPAASDRTVVHAGVVGGATAGACLLLGALSLAPVALGTASGLLLAIGASLVGAVGLATLGAFRGAGVGPTVTLVLTPLFVGLVAVGVATAAGVAAIDRPFPAVLRGVVLVYGLPAWAIAYVGGTTARLAYRRVGGD